MNISLVVTSDIRRIKEIMGIGRVREQKDASTMKERWVQYFHYADIEFET